MVEKIFRRRCVACHDDSQRLGGLNLDDGAAPAALVGRPAAGAAGALLVVPGVPERSYLFAKLVGTHLAAGGSGAPMPPGQGRLPADELTAIRAWIAAGAAP